MGPETLWIVEAGKQTYEWRCIAMVCQDDPIDSEDRDPVAPILPAEQMANAAFIVRACNAHDDLLAAMRALLPALLPDALCKEKGGLVKESRERCMAIVRAAISKATS